jgi:hypothetical protein
MILQPDVADILRAKTAADRILLRQNRLAMYSLTMATGRE